MRLTVIKPVNGNYTKTERFDRVLEGGLKALKACPEYAGLEVEWIENARQAQEKLQADGKLRKRRILFAVSLGEFGMNLELYAILEKLRKYPGCMEKSIGGILVDGNSELYTKSTAREIAATANRAGCLFLGKPLVEGTGSLYNFRIIASNLGTDVADAYYQTTELLLKRLMEYLPVKKEKPQILCLHASDYDTSNTLALWKMVKGNLGGRCSVREISLRDGEIRDCTGCSYNTCMHFSQRSSCFYGGTIVEEVYPAVEACDALVMACPNYNDAVGANLTAFINRLTALFRKRQFYEKYLFAVIVSGYSGGDILAKQLLDSLCMNKTFLLPGNFALMETANDAGSIFEAADIRKKAAVFAGNMLAQIWKEESIK
ncbi:MAG: NAD(P)H-dependent oxidoreductase [Eubacteriales bacterium]|nr:NAD(P)H-dependent oxidoreductase [Eubacteriales bacterium]